MKLEDLTGPVMEWTKSASGDNAAADALFDSVQALIGAEFNYRMGHFASRQGFEAHTTKIRREYHDRLLQLSGAK